MSQDGDVYEPDEALVDQYARLFGVDSAEAREIWHERAAIRQYLGGMDRGDAEAAAMVDLQAVLADLSDKRKAAP
jgi:hypothetical protein